MEAKIIVHVGREHCFNLARYIPTHVAAERHNRERAIAAPSSGSLSVGDTVTFEAFHLGRRRRLTSKIVAMERPCFFVDEMQSGAFAFLRHTHRFHEVQDGTLMTDKLEFAAPFGLLGWIAERLFLRRYMIEFLRRHQEEFRKIAEQGPVNG